MYLSQNKWVNLGQNLHKCFMKTRRHNVSYIKTTNITFRELRKPAVRKKNAWPMAIDMVSLARLNILTFYFRQTILKTSVMAQISINLFTPLFSFAIESYIYETDFTLQKYHF